MLFFILFNSCKSGGHANYLSAQTAPFLYLLAIVVEFSRHFLGALSSELMRALQLEPAPGVKKNVRTLPTSRNPFFDDFFEHFSNTLLLYALTLRSRSHVGSFSTKLPSIIIIILCALRNLNNMWWVHRWQTHLCFLNKPKLYKIDIKLSSIWP